MKKNLRNVIVVLILVVVMGSFFMFCTPKTACYNLKKKCEGNALMDQVMTQCENALENASQAALDCVGQMKECSLTELGKCLAKE